MKKILLAILIGLSITIYISNNSENVHANLAHHLIRFHVVANSNSLEDQVLKESVKSRIIKETKHLFDETGNIEQNREIILRNMDDILQIAHAEVQRWEKDYDTQISLGIYSFPTRKYGTVTLPAGDYEALRIVIGEGDGDNWWCVLFPPLCFIDATQGEMSEDAKQKLKEVLTEDEYSLITNADVNGEIPVVIRFKIVEWWQNSRTKIQAAFNTAD